MAVQGLDRAFPPDAATAKRMLAKIGGRWWNVYIGGPQATHAWKPADLTAYLHHGIDRFMLTYVGRQEGGPLTRAQGTKDADDALRIARSFGYSGDFPLCLDVEGRTYNSAPGPTVEYAHAWCAHVRAAGARPGIYANPAPLQAMAKANVDAEFVWVASWVSHVPGKHDPRSITGLPDSLWKKKGRRAWQYAGAADKDTPCKVLGVDVDISVADMGLLAGPPGTHPMAGTASASILELGDEGVRVQRLTSKLSFVRSKATGRPYLDGRRRRFDAETQRAVKAFQREHGLDDDGRVGEHTAGKLRAAVERQRQHRPHPANGKPAETGAHAGGGGTAAPRDVATLAARAAAADRAEDKAFAALVARGLQLRRRVAALEEKQSHTTEALLGEIVGILRRIEHDVEEIGEEVEAEQATATVSTSVKALVTELEAYPPPPPEGPKHPADGHAAVAVAAGDVRHMADGDLVRLVRAHDAAIDAARGELVERFTKYERRLERLRGHTGGGAGGATKPAAGHGDGHKPVTKPGGGGGKPAGGSRADIRLGDEGWAVRGSKIALARYLKAKGAQEHTALRRALRREARRPKGDVATQRWQKAVRAAQHLAGQRVTGVLDGNLQQVLRPHWPTDSAVRRLVRQTVAWRLIPGQVSPNFNIREFGCKDGTPYVTGLVREQHLSKDQARRRARELATRLERVRKADGGKPLQPTSVYRTIAHNASLPGAVPNSSHLRGFAADLPAPAGVPLEVHHKHVRAAFEAGCGLYLPAAGNFVHGDFDRVLGLSRDWTRP
jgi:peptidoglycan hydrolase-like protein with peptidoglycan-binding domain